MPTLRKGETQKEWIARCVPYLMDEGKTRDQALATCYGMWKAKHPHDSDESWLAELNSESLFHANAEFKVQTTTHYMNCNGDILPNADDTTHEVTVTRRMIALVGDRFMNGGFFSYELLKNGYKQWEGTLHDINHMGTAANSVTGTVSDITYFVGYHSNVVLDEANKSVSMDINVVDSTQYAAAWKGFIELCDRAGKIPNVSVTYFGQRKFIKVSDLPNGVDYESEGYSKDDYVPYLTYVQPICVSTVLIGRCDDTHGCGIRNTCSCGNNELDELIQRIKELQEKLHENN
jgi:hypothetical protein